MNAHIVNKFQAICALKHDTVITENVRGLTFSTDFKRSLSFFCKPIFFSMFFPVPFKEVINALVLDTLI